MNRTIRSCNSDPLDLSQCHPILSTSSPLNKQAASSTKSPTRLAVDNIFTYTKLMLGIDVDDSASLLRSHARIGASAARGDNQEVAKKRSRQLNEVDEERMKECGLVG